jgi:hypothetical protein
MHRPSLDLACRSVRFSRILFVKSAARFDSMNYFAFLNTVMMVSCAVPPVANDLGRSVAA